MDDPRAPRRHPVTNLVYWWDESVGAWVFENGAQVNPNQQQRLEIQQHLQHLRRQQGQQQGQWRQQSWQLSEPRVRPEQPDSVQYRPDAADFTLRGHGQNGRSEYSHTPAAPNPASPVLGHARGRQRFIAATPGDYEALDPRYQKQRNPRGFFTLGCVFLVYWPEPMGQPRNPLESNITYDRHHGQGIYSKHSRYLVVEPHSQHSVCVRLLSYGEQGVGKPGVVKSEHCIAWSEGAVPDPKPLEEARPNEEPMLTPAVRVDNEGDADALSDVTRIDYGRHYTVEHYVKVRPFGRVNPENLRIVLQHVRTVWERVMTGLVETNEAAYNNDLIRRRSSSAQQTVQIQSHEPLPEAHSSDNAFQGIDQTSVDTATPAASIQYRRDEEEDQEADNRRRHNRQHGGANSARRRNTRRDRQT